MSLYVNVCDVYMGNQTSGNLNSTSFLNALSSPVFLKDLKGKYLDCNKAFEQFTGKKREDIIGHSAQDVFPDKIAKILEDQFLQICESSGTTSFEFMIQFPDGKKSYYLIKYSSVFDDTFTLSGVTGVVMDISPIKIQALDAHQAHVERCHKKQDVLLSESESLQIELRENQRELAAHLSLLVQNEKHLQYLLSGMESLRPFLDETGTELYKSIRQNDFLESFNENWIEFERKFDEIHYSFYHKLEEICEGITRSEKKLCAYLKMNLTSSDISTLEKKSLNSINVAFSRLREKFNVSSNTEIKSRMENI
ncbi:PAS domain-containing protein [Bacteroidota bacterium]